MLCKTITMEYSPGGSTLQRDMSEVCYVSWMRSSFGDRTFAAAGPQVWNNLPPNLRLCGLSYGHFRQSQDHKSGTICRPISDSVGCHTAISGSRWRYFYSDSETTVQCELFLTAPNRNILTYLLSCAFLLAVKVRFVLVAGVRHRRLWVAEAAEILLGLGARQLCRPHVELSLRLRLWISRMFTTSSHYPTHGQPAILIRYLYYSNVCCHKFDDM